MNAEQALRHTIEEMAAKAWPAAINQPLEMWRLRATGGVTRRANSVLPLGAMPAYARWLDDVTEFYTCLGLPVRFQISEASPPELDQLLDGLGYTLEAPTSVQVARYLPIIEEIELNGRYESVIFDSLDEQWLAGLMTLDEVSRDKRDVYRHILSKIGPPTGYVQIYERGNPVAVGMAVSERGWSGLFNIVVAKTHRRQGLGTQIVQALSGWSRQNRAENLYLQVMFNNQGAIKLYGKLGFRHFYKYHYRSLLA